MRERAQVRSNRDGTWTATLPLFGFRPAPETRTLPSHAAACRWARRALTRYPGSIAHADAERDWQ